MHKSHILWVFFFVGEINGRWVVMSVPRVPGDPVVTSSAEMKLFTELEMTEQGQPGIYLTHSNGKSSSVCV